MNMQSPVAADVANEAQPAEFLAEREALIPALNMICRVVEGRNTIPILSNVLVQPCGRGVRFTGTDLDGWLSLDVEAAWGVPGAFTVPAEALRDMVRKAPKGSQVTFTADPDAGRLTIAAGRMRSTLAMLPVDDMPVIGYEGEPVTFVLDSRDLVRDFAALEPAISREETRYYLNGIALQPVDIGGEPSLVMVATDGGQLARVARPLPVGAEALASSIIPRKAVGLVKRRLSAKGDAPTKIQFEILDGKARIAGQDWSLVTKLIDGTFPDWQATIDAALGEGGLQRLAMIELHPRLNLPAIAKLAKAAGADLDADLGESGAILSARDYPGYQALTMFMREGAAPKGFGFNEYDHAREHVVRYAEALAAAAGLPKLTVSGTERDEGIIRGVTFGEATWIKPEPVVHLCYETFTESVEYPEGYHVYQDGAYSIPIPATHGALVTAEIAGDEAGLQPVRTNAKGEIALSDAAVAFMVGAVADAPRVDIPRLQFLHGEIVRDMYIPGPPMVTTRARGGGRAKVMSDRDQMAAYCADPVGFMEKLRARPLSELREEQRREIASRAAPEPKKRDLCPGPMYRGETWADVFAHVEANPDLVGLENIDGVISIVNLWKTKGGKQRTRVPKRLQPDAMRLWEGQAERVAAECALENEKDAARAVTLIARFIADLVAAPAEAEPAAEPEPVNAPAEAPADAETVALRAEIAGLKETIATLESKLTDALYVALRMAEGGLEPQPVPEPVVIEATFDAFGRSYSTPVLAGFNVGADQAETIADLEARLAESESARAAAVNMVAAQGDELDRTEAALAEAKREAQANAERALEAEIAKGRLQDRLERFGPLLDAAERIQPPLSPMPADIADYRIPAAA